MKVDFKNSFYIEGYQFKKGVQEVPDRFKSRLPSSAEVLTEPEAKKRARRPAKPQEPMTLKEAADAGALPKH